MITTTTAGQETDNLAERLVEVDYLSLISRADLTYETPVIRPEHGIPIGNGRMGSMLWTTPGAIRFQLNRVDVFGCDSTTNSFYRFSSDYASGCGYVDIHVVDFGEDVFTDDEHFRQHLSVYDALASLDGKGVSARVLAWEEQDVMAVEFDDRRDAPAAVNIDLRMLRYAMELQQGENDALRRAHAVKVSTHVHDATSKLEIRNGRIVLTQHFSEGDFYCASAVVIGVIGRESKASYHNELTVRLSTPAARGRFTILMATAATFDRHEDVADTAMKRLHAAERQGFDAMLETNKQWWHKFWSRAFVSLRSKDGSADYIEQNYTWFLYIMAASSRGDFAPRYGGMIWYTNGDMRFWGSQQMFHKKSAYYAGLAPANRFELLGPLFDEYTRIVDSLTLAAEQQWESRGVWLPETEFFNGPERLPEDVASEMRELYLLRKPWDERSPRFLWYASTKNFTTRWQWGYGQWENGRWKSADWGAGPYAHTTHMFSSTAKLAYLFWQRYEHTMDVAWLRDRAYPFLRGAVDFYCNFPNFVMENDGKYHIHHTNNNESVWGTHDTIEDLSAIRGMTYILIRASEVLGIDADMRTVWREFYNNLAPLPTNELIGKRAKGRPEHWVQAVPPARHGDPSRPNTVPMVYYDLVTVETVDQRMVTLANQTFNARYPDAVDETSHVAEPSRDAVAAAHLGRADAVRHLIYNQIHCRSYRGYIDPVGLGETGLGVLPNRLTLREGAGTIGAQRLGIVAQALHAALLHAAPPEPGADPIINVFPAWPRDWDAVYTLLTRGAFLVTASIAGGKIEFVQIESQAGGDCRLRNPWPDHTLTIYRDGKSAGELDGSLLTFPTEPGEMIVIAPKGVRPTRKFIS